MKQIYSAPLEAVAAASLMMHAKAVFPPKTTTTTTNSCRRFSVEYDESGHRRMSPICADAPLN